MDSERWQRIKALYRRAQQLRADERREFVESQCGDDVQLTAAVMKLVDASTHGPADIAGIVESAAGSMSSELPAGARVGPYRLLEVLGSGGMGRVYLAERADREFEQRVAIKMVNLPFASPSAAGRFRQERQILANLDHRNIARLLDGGRTESGVPYLVMEYIDGEPIVDYCAAHGLSLKSRLDLFLRVCDAVQYAHRQLTVHRDIKPSNILVTRDGVPKLLDFGVAKLLDAGSDVTLTRAEARILTPEYASPEQILGKPVTLSTDVYALGVLLYEMLTGSRPFRSAPGTPANLLELVCRTVPVEPSRAASTAGDQKRAARIAGDLDRIVMKAIRKEPERRYETVRDLAEDVRNFLHGRPVSARAPSWYYRSAKFVERNRAAVAAAVIGIVATLAMAVFHTTRLADERDRANLAAREAEEVSGFLAELFKGASPATAQGDEITALDLLEEGRDRIDRLDAEPVLTAKLYKVLGESYTQLGVYDDGLALLETAVELLDGDDEADPLLVADAVASLAETKRLMERHEEAIAGYRRALTIRQAHLGADHVDVAFAMSRLAGALGWQGRSDEALDLLRRAIAIKTRHADLDEELLDILGITAVNLAQSGRFEEAIETNQRALDLSTELLGELHPATVIRLSNAGIFHHQAYRTTDGLRLLDSAIEKTERIRPADHPGLSYNLRWRASMLQRLGRFDEALTALEAAAAITRAGGRQDSMEAVSNLYALGRLRLERGDASAYGAYQDGLRLAMQRGPRDGPAVYAGKIGTASALVRQGELATAERLFNEALSRPDRFQKSVEWNVRKELATVLSRQGRFEEASQQFARIFAEQEYGPEAPTGAAIEVLIERAAHYRRAGRFERAESDAELARTLAAERLPAGNRIIARADAELARTERARQTAAQAVRLPVTPTPDGPHAGEPDTSARE